MDQYDHFSTMDSTKSGDCKVLGSSRLLKAVGTTKLKNAECITYQPLGALTNLSYFARLGLQQKMVRKKKARGTC